MEERKLEELYERFRRDGDAEALAELFDACAPALLALARRLLPNAADVDDVVQSTFVTLIQSSREFDGSRDFLPWALGVLAMHARTARRRTSASLAVHAAEPLGTSIHDAHLAAEGAELDAVLREVLRAMPAPYRDVLVPYLSLGASPAEIAERLQITANATRVRLHRGLRLLRRALPSGFAGAGVVAVAGENALGAMRASVLEAAARTAVPSTSKEPSGDSRSDPERTTDLRESHDTRSSNDGIQSDGTNDARTPRDSVPRAEDEVGAGTRHLAPRAPRATSAARFAGLAALVLSIPVLLAWLLVEREGPDAGKLVAAADRTFVGPARETARAEDAASRAAVPAPSWRLRARVVAAESGAPIVGARVWITPAGAASRELKGTSGGDGRVECEITPAEEPSLFVDAADRAPLRIPLSARRRDDFFNASRRVVDELARTIQYGDLRLERGVEVSARVERADDASPIAGASVLLFHSDVDDHLVPATEHVVGTSDAGGAVRFDGLLPLAADPRWRCHVFLASTSEGLAWARCSLASRARMRKPVAIVLGPTQSIQVEVQGHSGEPLAGARVELWPLVPPFPRLFEDFDLGEFLPLPPVLAAEIERTSGADGRAAYPYFPCSRPDQESVFVGSRFSASVRVSAPPHGFYAAMRDAPRDREQRRLVARLQSSGGARSERTLIGTLRDEDGGVLAGGRIEVEEGTEVATSDERGSFTLRLAAREATSVVLRATAEGLAPLRFAYALDDDASTSSELDLVLSAPRALRGTLVDDDGIAIAGARVRAWTGVPTFEGQEHEIAVASDGTFLFEATGRHRFWVVEPLPPLDGQVWETPERTLVDTRAPPPTLVARRIDAGRADLVIEVVDAEEGIPLEPHFAWIGAAPGSRAQVEALPRLELGRATFEALPDGEYDVVVHAVGEGTGHARCRVVAREGVARARVEIGRLARIVGRVTCDGGPPDAPITVRGHIDLRDFIPQATHWSDHGRISATVLAAPDGSFVLDRLAPGPWRVGASSEVACFDPRELWIAVDEDARVEFEGRAAGVLELVRAGPPRKGVCTIEIERDGAWEPHRELVVYGARTTVLSIVVPAGRVHWRMSFSEADGASRYATELPHVLLERIDDVPVRGSVRVEFEYPARLSVGAQPLEPLDAR